jgi:uncharacterized protein YndB with AHSA1/START domain
VSAGESATVTVVVAVAPEAAFEVFTAEVDRWWRRGPRYRVAGGREGSLRFEPGAGGRLVEEVKLSAGTKTFEIARVTAWEPPSRLLLAWRNVNFAPGESTEVEVTFTAVEGGTKVVVVHRGWGAIRKGHPARHGLEGAAFSRMIGMWWADLLTALRESTAR